MRGLWPWGAGTSPARTRSTRYPSLVAGALGLAVAAGCHAPRPAPPQLAVVEPSEPAPRWNDGIPNALVRLDLSEEQRTAVRAVLADLDRRAGEARAKQREFHSAIVGAARSCTPDDARLHIEATRFVEASERARPAVLDAINALHGILDPHQRATLIDRILAGQESLGDDSEDQRMQSLGAVAEALDLSFKQKLSLVRAAASLDIGKVLTSDLKAQVIEAAQAFKEDDFDIRRHRIARAALVALYTRFMLDLAHLVLPVLEPRQCQVAARLLRARYR